MKLTKKYYIITRGGKYDTHGEGQIGLEIKTNPDVCEVEEFANKEKYLLELGKYPETIELEEI